MLKIQTSLACWPASNQIEAALNCLNAATEQESLACESGDLENCGAVSALCEPCGEDSGWNTSSSYHKAVAS